MSLEAFYKIRNTNCVLHLGADIFASTRLPEYRQEKHGHQIWFQ